MVLGATLIVLAVPARATFGAAGLEAAGMAVGVCLAVGWAVVLVVENFCRRGREVAALFLGMSVRMGLVLTIAVAICLLSPTWREAGFLWWLAASYLVTLVIETRLLLAASNGRLTGGPTAQADIPRTTIETPSESRPD